MEYNADSGSHDGVHKHIWEHGIPIQSERPDGTLWNGPYECLCGKTAWLTEGVLAQEEVTPEAPSDPPGEIPSPLERLTEYRERLGRGDSLTEEEQRDIARVGEDLLKVLRPILEALAESVKNVLPELERLARLGEGEVGETASTLIAAFAEHDVQDDLPEVTVHNIGEDSPAVRIDIQGYAPVVSPVTGPLSLRSVIGDRDGR